MYKSLVMLHWQVLGRRSPFPLILLPQFGGYWIEGTNHQLGDTEQLQLLSPNTRTKLECNTTATLYRKHFLGKVSGEDIWKQPSYFNQMSVFLSFGFCLLIVPTFDSRYFINHIQSRDRIYFFVMFIILK